MNDKVILPYNIEKNMSIATRKEYYENLKRYCVDNVVPNIISGKDLDYLSDMFNWNYTGYKELYNTLENISDNEVKTMISRVSEVLYNNMTNILNVLGGTYE